MKPANNIIAMLLSLVLLAGMAVARMTRPAPKDAEPYHRQVRKAVESLPYRIGDWVGTDQEVPQAAMQMLQPNVLLSRQYRNMETGRVATLLLVHCKDARDLGGHYPPVCYPAHGWVAEFATPRDWNVASMPIHGTEYGFSFKRPEATKRVIVANFMVLPGSLILRDMKGVRRAAADYTRHFYGAAQIQLMMDTAIPDTERDATFAEIIGALRDAIHAILDEPAQ